MNLRQLEAFRATMRSGSITGASKLMHISQPSVSRLIHDLEKSLGFKLFVRSGQGLTSTIEARRFQQSVEATFVGLDKLQETADAIRNAKDETVNLSIISILADSIMPRAVGDIHKQNTSIKIDISVRNTPEIVDSVLLQQTDLGVICPQREYDGIQIVHQTSIPYFCLLPEDHRFSKKGQPVDLHQLANQEIIMLDSLTFEQVINNERLLKQFRENSRINVHSVPAISSLASQCHLPAIVDGLSAIKVANKGGIIARSIKQNLDYPLAIITRGNETISIAAQSIAGKLGTAIKSELKTLKIISNRD